jgi:hypothetical protein
MNPSRSDILTVWGYKKRYVFDVRGVGLVSMHVHKVRDNNEYYPVSGYHVPFIIKRIITFVYMWKGTPRIEEITVYRYDSPDINEDIFPTSYINGKYDSSRLLDPLAMFIGDDEVYYHYYDRKVISVSVICDKNGVSGENIAYWVSSIGPPKAPLDIIQYYINTLGDLFNHRAPGRKIIDNVTPMPLNKNVYHDVDFMFTH